MRRKGLPIDGIVLLDKPLGMSSNAALQITKKLFHAAKAGHTGTLDPLASGLLPLCFGEATKFSADLLHATKTYVAQVKLGQTTTTGDLEGEYVKHRPVMVGATEIESVLERFRGDIMQVPPMFSALKRDGKVLYELAREGVEVEREARRITISQLNLQSFEDDVLTIEVTCSKGTYIRVLAEDIGEALGCGAHLVGLRRTAVADLSVQEAVTIQALQEMTDEQRLEVLAPIDRLMQTLPVVLLDYEQTTRFCHGQRLALGLEPSERVRVYGPENKMVGTARVTEHGVLAPERLIANK